MTQQFIVQRAATGDVLTYDATGLSAGPITRQLSAVGSVTLTMDLSAAVQTASDGLPLLQEWGSVVTVQEAGTLRFRGIVIKITGGTVELASVATYPHGIPYSGSAYYAAEVDPADVVRKLWAHVQSFPDADLGVTVLGTTPVRLGSHSTERKNDATKAYNAAAQDYTTEKGTLKKLRAVVAASRKDYTALSAARTAANDALIAAKKIKPKNQPAIDDAQNALNRAALAKLLQRREVNYQQKDVDRQAVVVAAKKKAKDAANQEKRLATQREQNDGGAYTILPWEASDCGQRIDELAKAGQFDWHEDVYWDGDLPATRIVIAYPRLGRRLDGDGAPTFQQGVNITKSLVPEAEGDEFANAVYGIGAGEGAGAIRRAIGKRDGRLRRVATFQAKDVKSNHNMDVKLRAELTARQQPFEVKQITVADHPNSPRGSYSFGDDIYVEGQVPHFGKFQLWHRILGITDNLDGTSDLTLARTDSFTYGKGLTE
ncbi:hypothetical protein E9228_002762 [Curtobacterium flaccumfaciens]|uniref:Uncharacterized protein n=1 Tax=Curtobacterium salicis TaxID=1779862 RepID=A0ABX0TAS4_9MICO|nr:hypothetical protein [Curtobacterium sp. WW7]NII42104.1 hypothetical protein [Curtobacterium sp. WW7]